MPAIEQDTCIDRERHHKRIDHKHGSRQQQLQCKANIDNRLEQFWSARKVSNVCIEVKQTGECREQHQSSGNQQEGLRVGRKYKYKPLGHGLICERIVLCRKILVLWYKVKFLWGQRAPFSRVIE